MTGKLDVRTINHVLETVEAMKAEADKEAKEADFNTHEYHEAQGRRAALSRLQGRLETSQGILEDGLLETIDNTLKA